MKGIIDFIKYRFVMITISVVLLVGGLAGTILQGGFNLGVDFEAGLSLQVEIDPSVADADIASVRESLSDIPSVQVQVIGSPELQRFSVRMQDNGETTDYATQAVNQVESLLTDSFGSVALLSQDYVEPRFASDLAFNATKLVVLAMLGILAYLWIRFRFAYALSSLTALVHDIAFMILFIGTFQIEVTSATIAAVLTIIGYSLNDTIVIFDRIRENEANGSDPTMPKVINRSITQSLSRTIITSLTTLLAVASIYVFTTGQIQDFALNMIVGVVIGTYSSIFIASPTLLGLSKGKKLEKTPSPAKEGAVNEESSNVIAFDSSSVKAQIRAQRNSKKK